MRVVFMGTPEFATTQLEALAVSSDVHEIVAVYTRPDAVSGRGSRLRRSPVKEAALRLGLPVRQPATLRDADEQAVLRGLAPEVIVVAAYGLIFPPEVLEIPPHGCVNVHASLLPRWRGAAPIQRAILAGDPLTGVSIMRMEEGLDTGSCTEVVQIPVDDLTASQLSARLAELGAVALLRALDRIAAGTDVWIAQNEADATYADKVGRIDVTPIPEDTVEMALRKVRASDAHAPARISIDGRGLTILSAARSAIALQGGRVAPSDAGPVLSLRDGSVAVTRLRPDGKKEMDGLAWLRGARLGETETWAPLL